MASDEVPRTQLVGDEVPGTEQTHDSDKVDRSKFLGRRYWVIRWVPASATTTEQLERLLDQHLRWLVELERAAKVVMSGPVLSGPGVAPGSGFTVLRVDSEPEALAIAAQDPLVIGGLRTFEVYAWLVNEGDIQVRISLGTGTYVWH